MRWAVNVDRMETTRNVCKSLVRNTEGKRPLGRPKCGWEDNIKMYRKEIRSEGSNRLAAPG